LPKIYLFALIYASLLGFGHLIDMQFVNILYILATLYSTAFLMARIYSYMNNQWLDIKNNAIMAIEKLPGMFIAFLVYAIPVLFGVLCGLLPGIVLHFILIFLIPMVLFDNHGIKKNFMRCFELVWPHWWRTALTLGLPFLAYFIIVICIYLVVGLVYHLLPLSSNTILTGIYYVIGILLSAIYVIFWLSLLLLQFNDLKLRRHDPKQQAEVM
jgi:hypothetical protein